MMRNKHGIEIKRGHWVYLVMPKGDYEGRVVKVSERDKLLTLDDGYQYPTDAVTQTLGPMVRGPDGVVTQNPLVRVKVGSPMQRPRRTKTGGVTTAPGTRQKTRRAKTARTKVKGVYANPRSEVPGDFSQSSMKVLGRPWSSATKAQIDDFKDCAAVKITWPDGEWLRMLFDDKAGALSQLKKLGFVVQ